MYGHAARARILNILENTQHNDISQPGHQSSLTENRASDWVWSLNSSPAVSLASPQAMLRAGFTYTVRWPAIAIVQNTLSSSIV